MGLGMVWIYALSVQLIGYSTNYCKYLIYYSLSVPRTLSRLTNHSELIIFESPPQGIGIGIEVASCFPFTTDHFSTRIADILTL